MATTQAAPQFKRTKQVTLPVLKMKPGVERFVKLTDVIRTGKKVSDTMQAAEVCPAIDLVSGQRGLLIVPYVMQQDLKEHYPENAYVGKSFAVLFTRVPGKRYNIPTIDEIEEPAVIPTFNAAAAVAQSPEGEPDADGVIPEDDEEPETKSPEGEPDAAPPKSTPIAAKAQRRR